MNKFAVVVYSTIGLAVPQVFVAIRSRASTSTGGGFLDEDSAAHWAANNLTIAMNYVVVPLMIADPSIIVPATEQALAQAPRA